MDDRLSYDAVLCDLDGVLRLYDTAQMPLEKDLGLPAGTVMDVAFAPGMVDRAVSGELTDEQWQEAMTAALTPMCGAAEAAALVAAFVAWPDRVNTPVLEILTEVRRRVPVVLVSNATTRLERDLVRLGLLDAVDIVVNSARVGVAKPDRRIYEIAAARVNVRADRCVFIDDRQENVDAARTLGMSAILYRHPGDLHPILQPANVP